MTTHREQSHFLARLSEENVLMACCQNKAATKTDKECWYGQLAINDPVVFLRSNPF